MARQLIVALVAMLALAGCGEPSSYDVTYTINGQPDKLSLRVGNGLELVRLPDEGIVRKGTARPGQRLSLDIDAVGDPTGWVDCEIKVGDTVATSFGWGKCNIELTMKEE